MNGDSKCPLSWPERWPRTNPVNRKQSRFFEKSVIASWEALQTEMNRMRTSSWFMSSNLRPLLNGRPVSDRPNDPGVAVYFDLNGKKVSLACDKWIEVQDNIWALAKHIEALRGQERWGVGTMEQAFRGYMALPGIGESSAADWWTVLGVAVNSSEAQVKDAHRILVKKHHPDRGGDAELFNRISKAWENFQSTLNGK